MLPEKFKERMKRLLKDEYGLFLRALTEEDAVRGFRVNPLKISCDEFEKISKLPAEALSYADGGYMLTDSAEGIGNSPLHASGMIYVQDPGAMASIAAVPLKPGMKVADLCAAPGGKSSQLAAAIGDSGFLLSNEYVSKRAKILVSNFERLGVRNAYVTSCDTGDLAKLYPDFFDLVVADVPCSGEGMFRKAEIAISEWSEENVELCAKRGREILDNGARMVAPGGYLLYSTCTYSIEENEMAVDWFLEGHPEFEAVPVAEKVRRVTADGIEFEGAASNSLKLCRRFYPHITPGEGQFLALLKRQGTGTAAASPAFKEQGRPLNSGELAIVTDFLNKNLCELPSHRIVKHGENISITLHAYPLPPKNLFAAGVLIGEIRGKNLFPSHQLFSAYGDLFLRKENLTDESRARAYLNGEQIDALSVKENGYCAILYHGVPLGGGKCSGGKINNHYPKGLRIKG